jgi:hypothetical protein
VNVPPDVGGGEPAEEPQKFTLSPELSNGELTRAQLAEWSALYQTGARQLRRWWKEGAPLDRPSEMPAWWAGHHKWAVPVRIHQAAKLHTQNAAAASVEAVPCAKESGSPENSNTTAAPASPLGPSIDLAEYALRENEDVRQAETLVAVAWQQLEAAYKAGRTDIDLLHRRHEKAMETLRKVRTAARADLQQRRLLIPREEVENDRAMAAELLRQMRESMERRVLELCPDLNTVQREKVAAAIRRVRKHEEKILCDPKYLRDVKTADDLAELLAA